MIKTECAKCGGKGEIKAFSNIAGGVCFCCNGKGYIETKRKPSRCNQYQITAINKATGDRETVFHIKAKNEKQAIEMSIIQLMRGNLYIPESALLA